MACSRRSVSKSLDPWDLPSKTKSRGHSPPKRCCHKSPPPLGPSWNPQKRTQVGPCSPIQATCRCGLHALSTYKDGRLPTRERAECQMAVHGEPGKLLRCWHARVVIRPRADQPQGKAVFEKSQALARFGSKRNKKCTVLHTTPDRAFVEQVELGASLSKTVSNPPGAPPRPRPHVVWAVCLVSPAPTNASLPGAIPWDVFVSQSVNAVRCQQTSIS